jgi:osmoprotectant transport system substrate-binding protein
LTAAFAALAIAGVSACGGSSTSSESTPESTTDTTETTEATASASLDGATFRVGSKDFTESILLGKIVKILLEENGAKVDDKTNIKGSVTTREAMLANEIDMYWEYTGTAWFNYLAQSENVTDPDDLYLQVVAGDAENGVTWLAKTDFNNTYAFAITQANAEKYGVTTLSEAVAKMPAEEQVWCVESEFQSRPDGWPGLQSAYGISVTEEKILDTGAIYQATADNQCVFGEVFATDGRIPALGLVVLDDDLNYFPVYNAALTVLTSVIAQYPQLADIINPVVSALTNEAMATMNAEVDVTGEDADTVARNFLIANGFISS